MKYKLIIDNGKPSETIIHSREELIKALESAYKDFKLNEYPHFEVFVFNERDEDISERMDIQEYISEIMGEILK